MTLQEIEELLIQILTQVALNAVAIELFKNQYATNDDINEISKLVNTIIKDNNQIHADVATLSDAVSRIDHLNKLNDVKITNLTQGDVLQYDSALGLWCNVKLTVSSENTGGVTSLRDLHDVQITSLANGHCLVYNTSKGKWINDTVSTGGGGTLDLSNYLTKTVAEATYLNKTTGGTVEGPLVVDGNLTGNSLATFENNVLVGGGVTIYK